MLYVLICPWCYPIQQSYLSPPESLQSVCKFQAGSSVWARHYRPNAVQKWTKRTMVTPVGIIIYNVYVEGGNHRKVHINHLLQKLPVRQYRFFPLLQTLDPEIKDTSNITTYSCISTKRDY